MLAFSSFNCCIPSLLWLDNIVGVILNFVIICMSFKVRRTVYLLLHSYIFVQNWSRLKWYLPRHKSTMNKTSIFFRMIALTFVNPVSFSLVLSKIFPFLVKKKSLKKVTRLKLHLPRHKSTRGSPYGVVANVLSCDVIVLCSLSD